jgi:hypothetical protein
LSKLDLAINLPVDMDANLRRDLTELFRRQAVKINQLSQDTTRVSAATTIAVPLVLADASGGALNLTLPPALDWDDAIIRVKKMDSSANVVNVLTTNSETIDGTLTVAITVQYTAVQLMSDGSQWVIV